MCSCLLHEYNSAQATQDMVYIYVYLIRIICNSCLKCFLLFAKCSSVMAVLPELLLYLIFA